MGTASQVLTKDKVKAELSLAVKMVAAWKGYTLDEKGNKIIVNVPKTDTGKVDRTAVLKELGAYLARTSKLPASYAPREKSTDSSTGKLVFKGSTVIVECKAAGGNAGSNSWQTTLQECGQCYYSAAAWNKKANEKWTDDVLRKYAGSASAYESLRSGKVLGVDTVIKELSDEWKQTCIAIAEKLVEVYKKGNMVRGTTFHRLSPLVGTIEKEFNRLNIADNKVFTDVNKWNPADIWIVSSSFDVGSLSKAKTFDQLNGIIKNAIDNNDLIPASLKKAEDAQQVQLLKVNFNGKIRPHYDYSSYTFGKKGLLSSQDVFLMANQTTGYDGKKLPGVNHITEIQFRTFGSTWQGEVKGKSANQGKISGGPIERMFNETATGSKKLPATQTAAIQTKAIDIFKKKPRGYRGPAYSTFANEFYSLVKKATDIEHGKNAHKKMIPATIDDFYKEIAKKENPAGYVCSKYLGLIFMLKFLDLSDTEKTLVVNKFANYAKSQSPLSCPHLKCT